MRVTRIQTEFAVVTCLLITSGTVIPLGATGAPPTPPEATDAGPYRPTPENQAARASFQDARFGVFVHWGLYSVLARGEWALHNEKMSTVEYEQLATRFNPTRFDAAAWVSLFKRSGAKYVTFTAKHADGFAMWDSTATDWDVVDRTSFQRDILKSLAEECRRQDMKLFLYYSQLDWRHPDYYPRGSTGQYTGRPERGDWNTYLDYVNQQLAELLGGAYGQVGGVWLDGWWDQQTKLLEGHEHADPRTTNVDWRLRRTYDLIHSLQPACLIGNNHHLAPFVGEDFQMFERDLPGQNVGGHSPDAEIGNLPLETCNTINSSWGYNAGDRNYKSVAELIRYLVRTAGANANFLLNVGPLPDGSIDPEMVRRLEAIGRWMAKYGHTVCGTRGGPIGAQPWGTSTHNLDVIYLHILDRSTVDANGWITLTGADSLAAEVVRTLDGASVETRRNGRQLQVKIGQEKQLVDLVLTVRKSDLP